MEIAITVVCATVVCAIIAATIYANWILRTPKVPRKFVKMMKKIDKDCQKKFGKSIFNEDELPDGVEAVCENCGQPAEYDSILCLCANCKIEAANCKIEAANWRWVDWVKSIFRGNKNSP